MAQITYDIITADGSRQTVTKTVPDPTPEELNEKALITGLGDGAVFDNLRTIAQGSGTFATTALHAAATRTCARALVIIIRILLRKLDSTD